MNSIRKQSFNNFHENKENIVYNTEFKPREHHFKSNNIIIGHGSNFGKEPIRPSPTISHQFFPQKQMQQPLQPQQIQKNIINQTPQQNLSYNSNQFQHQNYQNQIQNQGQSQILNQNYLTNMDYQLQLQNQQLQLLLQQQLQLQKEQLQNQQMNYMKQINSPPPLTVNPTLPIPFASLPLPLPLPLPLLPLPFQNNELLNLTNQLVNSTPLTSPTKHDVLNPIFPLNNEIKTSTIGTKSDLMVKSSLSPTSSSSSSTSSTSSFNRVVGHQLKNQNKRNLQEMDRIRSRYTIQNGVKVRIRNQDLEFPTNIENKNSAKLLKTSPHYHFWSNRANLHVGVLTWETINSIPFNLSSQI